MIEESKVIDLVLEKLIDAGWNKDDILLDQRITSDGRLIQVDILLLYELYPLAVIEVKSSTKTVDSGTEQALAYSDVIDVPFAFSTNGDSIIEVKQKNKAVHFNQFPSPKTLWKELGHEWKNNDPLLYPALKAHRKPRYYHALAISRAIEHLRKKQKIQIVMAVGTGKSFVALQLVWKTLRSSFFESILVICASAESLVQTAKLFEPLGNDFIVANSHNKLNQISSKKVVLISQNVLLHTSNDSKLNSNFSAVVFLDDFNKNFVQDFSSYFKNSSIIVFSSLKRPFPDFELAYQFTLSDAILQEEEIKVPGYKQVSLGSVAEIKVSQFLKSKIEANQQTGLPIRAITARSILDNGTIDFADARNVVADERRPVIKLQPKDIVISSISSAKTKVGYVPDKFNDKVSFQNSLILIRVNSELVEPKAVFDFLSSPNGQLQLKRYATSLGMLNRISPSQVSGMPILIPEKRESKTDAIGQDFGVAYYAKEAIEKDILPLLEKLAKKKRDLPDNESQLEYVAEKLRSISLKLAPPKLEAKILNQYPMPIAISYRRFLDSKFNAFEQILRLRDLFESAGFFIYNVVLADFLRNLDGNKYNIKDAGARRAFNGYSMSKRIDFLGEVLDVARSEVNKDDLFMPEILKSDIGSKLNSLGEFRNYISHTAAATESKQKKLIDKYQPIIEDILECLEFLTSYRLVRIPEFRFKNGRLVRKMEIFTGVVPAPDEFQLENDSEYIRAEADHLILLDQEDQFLDLFPIYQLLASDETHDETHMCFLKQRKTEQKKLMGESVQGSFEVTLDGYDVFEELQKKIK